MTFEEFELIVRPGTGEVDIKCAWDLYELANTMHRNMRDRIKELEAALDKIRSQVDALVPRQNDE